MQGQNINLKKALSDIVGSESVRDEDFVRHSYTRTPSWIRGKPPAIVVRASTTEAVSQIMKLANETLTPVIPRGGGASVCGFPLSNDAEKSILLDTTSLNRPISLNEKNLVVETECGILMSRLSEYVTKHGYHMNTVDMPQFIDTLGGALSGFNGGGEPSDMATEGEIGKFLLGLEVVLPTGEIIRTGSGPGTNIHQKQTVDRYPGSPDMTGMFIGDGGIFGIKTRASFHIFPKPEKFIYGAYEFKTLEQIWDNASQLMHMAPFPYTRALLLNSRGQDAWTLFYAVRGSNEEVAYKESVLKATCEKNHGRQTTDEQAMERIMRYSGRQLGKWFASRGKFLYFEYIFSKEDGPDYLMKQKAAVKEKFRKADVTRLITDRVSFMVPKERHSMVMGHVYFFDENKMTKEHQDILVKISDEESENVLAAGGFMEANQGAMTHMSASAWSSSYMAYMKTVKKALDPNNILNPGLWRLS